MKWLWITALLFLVTEVKSGPPTRKVGDIEKWKIESIKRTEKVNVETSEFQFTLVGTEVEGVTRNILVVNGTGSTEVPIDAIGGTEGQTPTFEWDLRQYSGQDVTIIITAQNTDHDDLAFSSADLTPFPKFPGGTETTTLLDPRPPKSGTLVRVEGSLGDMSLTSSGTLFKGDINYFAFPGSANYTPCINSNTVNVCDKELTHSDLIGTVENTTVSSAVLAYGSDGNATIKLTFPVTAAAVTYEAILIPQPPQSPEKNVLCTDAEFPGATCIIKWSDPSSAVLQLIIIQKPTGQDPNPDTWVTSTFDIHDRELAVTQLGADIIEGRWLMLDGEFSVNEAKKSTYRLRKTVLDPVTLEQEDIEVDCSHLTLDPKLCFGYFPGLKSDKTYTLTVAYKETDTAKEKDQIESLPVKITASKPELEILSRHTTTHQNQQRADVQICFQHLTPTEGRSFSHYEMLIINEKGQWLKHSLMQEEEEGGDASRERLCFAPFTINTTDFALTEATRVVVSQRAVDGITVLASGESALF